MRTMRNENGCFKGKRLQRYKIPVPHYDSIRNSAEWMGDFELPQDQLTN